MSFEKEIFSMNHSLTKLIAVLDIYVFKSWNFENISETEVSKIELLQSCYIQDPCYVFKLKSFNT